LGCLAHCTYLVLISCPDVSQQSGQLQESALYLFIIVKWMEKLSWRRKYDNNIHFKGVLSIILLKV
jgi:hypothetical protein